MSLYTNPVTLVSLAMLISIRLKQYEEDSSSYNVHMAALSGQANNNNNNNNNDSNNKNVREHRKPNIVFILADDLGMSTLNFY